MTGRTHEGNRNPGLPTTGGLVTIDGTRCYRIDGVDRMEPFLMSIASATDLWMFLSSTGALTAGRVDADRALLPYETEDRLHRAAGSAGPLTIVARRRDGHRELWRPFGPEPAPGCRRSISKSLLGDRVVLEETNERWEMAFRVTWAPSARFGWVRTTELADLGGDGAQVEVLDGLVDVMPAGVDAITEQLRSNLVDAYKRSETGRWGTVAIYTLESLITDRAEPAESLTANLVWSAGAALRDIHLDERVVPAMVAGRPRAPSDLLTGRRGSYLLRGAVAVEPAGSVSWTIVGDVALDHAQVLERVALAADTDAVSIVAEDVAAGSRRLAELLERADAVQRTADPIADAHHLSNVLFNSMRGGFFPHGYRISVADFLDHLATWNRPVYRRHGRLVEGLGAWTDFETLRSTADETGDPDLVRLTLEYLPLAFGRRHGDPSRPWNRFSIRVRTGNREDDFSYEGNWRDIFQNWEGLLHSYPAYFLNAVAKFVDASTVDGHNPYRISRDGIEWEVPDPEDPWSNIGYWGDHQIVYLLRLLEAWERFEPGAARAWLDRPVFVYADIPYTIADHDAMVDNPRHTISFDTVRAAAIEERVRRLGADGRLVVDAEGEIVRVGLLEKLLVPALAKLAAFVPFGGIWMNTQRPEWNDANNALAGHGLSMVTLYHLRRYLTHLRRLASGVGSVALTAAVSAWLADLTEALDGFGDLAGTGDCDDRRRRAFLDAVGAAGSRHRRAVGRGLDTTPTTTPVAAVERLCDLALALLDASIAAARRPDGLYASYNLLSFPSPSEARVDPLGVMLEGQVAALSSGALAPREAVAIIDALFRSELYRVDERSFMLYPIRRPAPFVDRNRVPDDAAADLPFLGELVGPRGVLARGPNGTLHFHSTMLNATVLESALTETGLDAERRSAVLDLYEHVFGHHYYTGRSRSMYAYEGIGSIYWHMVSKLLVAVQEVYWAARDRREPPEVVEALAEAYRRIREGLGFRKGPASFGGFPIDCHSHTPAGCGARQPGMTGQVKEQILARFGEIGLRVVNGRIQLAPGLLDISEVLAKPDLPGTGTARSAEFGFCGTRFVIRDGAGDSVRIRRTGRWGEPRPRTFLTSEESAAVFARSGAIEAVEFTLSSLEPPR